ncbi:hypothetical protein Tco_1111414 [Tanacetum coccineum]|uniref:Uncharacterized protein n=1 Tax=Tanacetum coccineum TaxID=301880 RepID=A0ABQ5ILK3_9ASTR
MGDDVDIITLTIEQYMALIQDDIRPGVVKPEIGNVIEFEINSNFIRELRCKLFVDHLHNWYDETTTKEKIDDSPDSIDAIQESFKEALVNSRFHITPRDDDYVAPATSPTLDKLFNEFGKECSDITRVAKMADGNPVKNIKELSDIIKTSDFETFVRKLLHQIHGTWLVLKPKRLKSDNMERVSRTSSTNDVNTAKPAYEVSTVSLNVNTASSQVSTASFRDNVVYAFMVENPNGSNLLQRDLEQIHEDDLESVSLVIRWDTLPGNVERQGTRRNDMAEEQVQTNMALMEFSDSEASKDLDKLLGSQINDKSKKVLGYNVVPLPHPLIYNHPKKLDLSYSGLDEFKEPELKAYGSEVKQVSKDISNFVESSLNVDKETVFPVDKRASHNNNPIGVL